MCVILEEAIEIAFDGFDPGRQRRRQKAEHERWGKLGARACRVKVR
jgi:hypothetical protein